MQDRGGVEADDVHHRRGRLQHERLAVEHVQDHRLHGVGRVVVTGADLDFDARGRGRLRVVDDRRLGQLAVGHDHLVAVPRAQLGGAPRDLDDLALPAPGADPVPDMERFFDLDGEARDEVAQRVLERQPRHDGADGRRREELLFHHERGHHREQDEHQDVLHDGREVVRHPIRPQGVDQHQDDEVNQRVGKQQLADGDHQRAHLGAHEVRGGEHRVDAHKQHAEHHRESYATANHAVGGEGADGEREPDEDEAGDYLRGERRQQGRH